MHLGCHHSSVTRELKRASVLGRYKAAEAQRVYYSNRTNSKPHGKWNTELCDAVVQKLKATWSPEQIAYTVTAGKSSFKTIYNWLYAGRLNELTAEVLRRKGKKKTCKNLALYARGTPIRKRPKKVHARKSFGHWELDTVVSPGDKSGCFATFVEQKTRFYTAVAISDRTAESMEDAIKACTAYYPKAHSKRRQLTAVANSPAMRPLRKLWG